MRYPLILLVLAAVVFAALAIGPPDRLTWALENSLALLGVLFLWRTHRSMPLSNAAYTSIFVFFVLHEIGAFFTYTLVPYDDLWEALFGRTLNSVFGWERNHYDRAAHLAFGLLLACPLRELVQSRIPVRRAMSSILAFQTVMSWSALYELVEWSAALVFGSETGAAYVGAQGDEWDSQKDMALAAGGAVVALSVSAIVQFLRRRNVASREGLPRG